MALTWKQGVAAAKNARGYNANVVTVGGTGSELRDKHTKGTTGVVMAPNMYTNTYTMSQHINWVAQNLPPGYTAVFMVAPNKVTGTSLVQLKMMLEEQVEAVVSFEITKEMVDDQESGIAQIDKQVEIAFNTLNIKAAQKFGNYPNIAAWAKKHNIKFNGNILNGNNIPGFVFPLWNKDNPNVKAISSGGLTDKTTGEVMAPQKRSVKVQQGAIPKRPVKAPECPKHETRMEFDATENIWECKEPECKIIFRPKADDRPPGTVLLGKGEITMKTDGKGSLILVSDDNVCLDISKYISDARFDVDQDYVQTQALNGPGLVNVPTNRRTLVTLEIVNMNVVMIK